MGGARCADIARGRDRDRPPFALRRSTPRRLRLFGEDTSAERLSAAGGASESSLSVSDHAETSRARRSSRQFDPTLALRERWRIGLDESRWKTSAPIAWVKLPPLPPLAAADGGSPPPAPSWLGPSALPLDVEAASGA